MGHDFESLANKHKDAVYRQLYRMCGNYDDAEDVLVESLVNAYKAIDDLQDEQAFRGWLAQIARRACGRLKKRQALQPVIDLASMEDAGYELPDPDTPEGAALQSETRGCIQSVINNLPEMYREVYEQRDILGLSAEEVRERSGLSIAAIKSRLHRARGMVRKGLDEALCTP
jgi:RNA polymerase sigma-70 factor (ECF subfamily)